MIWLALFFIFVVPLFLAAGMITLTREVKTNPAWRLRYGHILAKPARAALIYAFVRACCIVFVLALDMLKKFPDDSVLNSYFYVFGTIALFLVASVALLARQPAPLDITSSKQARMACFSGVIFAIEFVLAVSFLSACYRSAKKTLQEDVRSPTRER